MTAAKHAGSHETPYYPDPSEAQGINLTEILSILVRRRAVLLGTAGAVLLLVLAYLAFATPTYTATVQLLLEPKTQRTADERPSPDQLTLDGITTLVESQLRIIESRSVLYDVVASQQLEHDPEFNRRGLIPRAIATLSSPKEPDAERLRAFRALRRATTTRRLEKSFVIEVAVSSSDSSKAARLANAVADTYLAMQTAAAKQAVWRANLDQINARIISRSDPPAAPSWPWHGILIGLGVLTGVGFGTSFALTLDHFDDRLFTKRHVEAAGFPVVATIPRLDLTGGLARNADRSFLRFRDAIRVGEDGGFAKIILITSAGSREGKTTLMWNVAAAAARDGERVIVIPVEDQWELQFGRQYGGAAREYARQIGPLEQVHIPSVNGDDGNLSLLVRKIGCETGSEFVKALSEEVKQRLEAADVVLIDCGIANGTRLLRLLASMADTIVIVARAGRTRASDLEVGMDTLQPMASRIAGVVLNGTEHEWAKARRALRERKFVSRLLPTLQR